MAHDAERVSQQSASWIYNIEFLATRSASHRCRDIITLRVYLVKCKNSPDRARYGITVSPFKIMRYRFRNYV